MSPTLTESTVLRRHPRVFFHTVGEDLVLFPELAEPSDTIHVMTRSSARRIWELLDGKQTVGQLAERIRSEFEGEDPMKIQQDTLRFADELLQKQVVEIVAT